MVIKRSRGVMMVLTGTSMRDSKRMSRPVTMPTTLPPSITGKPDLPSCSHSAMTWRTVCVGVMANGDSPVLAPWRQLIERAFGTESRLRNALQVLPEVRGAWLFGSYAQRLTGQPGPAPSDVDVAVVVEGDPGAAYRACAQVGAVLALEVNATVFTATEWDSADDVFVRQLREGTLIDVLDDRGENYSEDAP